MDDILTSITIEYDCPCEEGEMCSHAFDAVKRAVQKAYDKGMEDGIKRAMSEVRSGLRAALKKDAKDLPPVDKKKKVLIN
jgi:hypothetical protein